MAYKFKLDIEDNVATMSATPIMEEVTQLYKNLASGIEQEIIDNMPPESLKQLLWQLLSSYISNDMAYGPKALEAIVEAKYAIEYDIAVKTRS